MLGGAPANVAYHLLRCGVSSRLISRVGNDPRGLAARARLQELGLDASGVQEDASLPTGAAQAVVDAQGQAHYTFTTPAAWDAIDTAGEPAPEVLVYGSLAQRDPRSANAIRALAARARRTVFDVNLRAPYIDRDAIEQSLRLAQMLKLNEDEAATLSDWFSLPTELRGLAAELTKSNPDRIVAITRGAAGACLWANGQWLEAPAPAVRVVDTVGAGDAFLASLVASWLWDRPWQEALTTANYRAAQVAASRGAMPGFRCA